MKILHDFINSEILIVLTFSLVQALRRPYLDLSKADKTNMLKDFNKYGLNYTAFCERNVKMFFQSHWFPHPFDCKYYISCALFPGEKGQRAIISPDKGNCGGYCLHGGKTCYDNHFNAKTQDCNHGPLFDKCTNQLPDWATLHECGGEHSILEESDEVNAECTRAWGEKWPPNFPEKHPSDPTKYIVCYSAIIQGLSNRPHLVFQCPKCSTDPKSCPNGHLHFNAEPLDTPYGTFTSRCEHADKSQCSIYGPPSIVTTEKPATLINSPPVQAPAAPVPAAPVPKAPVPAAPVPKAPVPAAPVPKAPVPAAPVPKAPVPAAPVPKAPVPAAPVPAAPVPKAPVTAAPVTAAPVTAAPDPAAPVPAAPVPAAPRAPSGGSKSSKPDCKKSGWSSIFYCNFMYNFMFNFEWNQKFNSNWKGG